MKPMGDMILPFPLDHQFLGHVALAKDNLVDVVDETFHHDEDTLDVEEVHSQEDVHRIRIEEELEMIHV